MLYGLIDYDYDYYKLIGYTEDLDEAYKYSTIKGCEIEPLERLKSDIDYSTGHINLFIIMAFLLNFPIRLINMKEKIFQTMFQSVTIVDVV